MLRRIRNIFPFKEKQAMIRIFAQAFVYGNIFSKSKTNMDDDKNENFRIEIVKKGLIFAARQYVLLKFT